MPEIYVEPAKRRFNIPDKMYALLCVYKIFWPPETTIQLGKKKVVALKDIYPWPTGYQITVTPQDQATLLDVPVPKDKKDVNLG